MSLWCGKPPPGDEPPVRKTSVRLTDQRQIDEFDALAGALGLRPHQLAAELVLEGIARYRSDPHLGEAMRQLVLSRRRARTGLKVIKGGAVP